MSLKFFCVAAAFGDLRTLRVETVVSGPQLAPSTEVATAQFVAIYYMQSGKRQALLGISVHEIAEAMLREAVDTIRAERESDVSAQKVQHLFVASNEPEGAA
jgi:hypothetical protein